MTTPRWLPRATLAIVVLTAAVRLAVMFATDSFRAVHIGEVDHIAVSLASGRGFVDAYNPGTGPTTHYTPGQPLLIAVCYALFGIDSHGELARQIQRVLFSCLLFGALPWIALRLGLGARAGVIAGLAGAAIPIHALQEIRGTGAILDSLFIAALALVSFSLWRDEGFSLRRGLQQGLLLGVACLFNPVCLIVAGGFGLYALYWFPGRRQSVLIHYGAVAAITVLCLLPWGIYNYQRMGRFVLTRGNLPLEMSLSFHPRAQILLTEAWLVPGAYPHPTSDAEQSARIRQLGEAAYMEEKKQQVLEFISAHPRQTLSLIAKRAFYFWFPDNGRLSQNLAFWLLTLLAGTGLFLLIRRRHPALPVFAVILLFFPPLYYLQMANTQYRLPIYWVFLMLAALPVDALLNRLPWVARSPELAPLAHHATSRSH